ncbi:MAG: hypothetical protein ABIR57_01365 [Aeromicrobium sp.]
MTTSEKSVSKKKRHPLRKLLFLAILTGIVVAIKNALEDKGGSYEAPAAVPTPTASNVPAPAPFEAPAATTVETAEEIISNRPVENLDEFADPVPAPPTAPLEAVVDEEPVDEAAPEEEKPRRRGRTRSSVTEAAENIEEPEDVADDSHKIDPFGIR